MKLEEIVQLNEAKVLTKAGVTRIRREDIPATIKYVSKLSGIPVRDLKPLGSVGKSATSGDVDLAVDAKAYNSERVHTKMVKALGDENAHMNKGTRVNSYAVPIAGIGDKKVQVDLMFADNVDWAQFAYYSAGEGSKYKGAIRTILLTSVAGALNEPGTDHFEYDDNGELTIRAGRSVDLNKGMRRIFQHRPKKKSGEGYLKTMKSIPIDKFKQMFPDVEIKGDDVIIDDPKLVVQLLFGKDTLVDDVRTAEQLLNLIKTKFNVAQREKILKIAKSRMSQLKGMKIPGALK